MIKGMGTKATRASVGDTMKKKAPTNTTLVAVRITSLAPTSKNRSSWLTSSLTTDNRPPDDRSSNQASSSV